MAAALGIFMSLASFLMFFEAPINEGAPADEGAVVLAWARVLSGEGLGSGFDGGAEMAETATPKDKGKLGTRAILRILLQMVDAWNPCWSVGRGGQSRRVG